MHGQFVWYDLMTTDVEAAKRFYSSLAGWSTELFDKSPPQNPYTLWKHEGSAIGGVVGLTSEQRARGIPPHWMPSVQVNNVDSTLRQAESLGGKTVVPPMDVPDTGRYAIIQDPQGAMIAIFTPKSGPMATAFDGTPRVGRVSWHELTTTDYKKAFDFYRQLFGWAKTSELDMGGGNMYFMYGMTGKMFGGMYNRPPNMASVPPFWLNYIFVKDLNKSLDSATRAGAKVVNGPMDVSGGKIVVLADPQGAAIALHQAVAVAAAPKPAARKKPKAAKRAKAKAAKSRPKAKAKSKKKTARKAAAKKASRRPKARAKKKRRR